MSTEKRFDPALGQVVTHTDMTWDELQKRPAVGAFTAADKLAEINRELRERHRVYGRLMELGKLTRERAERQVAILEAIKADYEAAVAKDPRAAGLLL